MSHDAAALGAQIAKTFIARKDVKAIQTRSGAYMPVTDTGKPDGTRLPWTMGDLKAHVDGRKTFGHYVVSTEDTAKMFCFDLDLEKEIIDESEAGGKRAPRWQADPPELPTMERVGNARELWHPTRLWQWCFDCRKGWYTDFQPPRCTDENHHQDVREGWNPDTVALTTLLQTTAFMLASRAQRLLEIPVAVAYSGNKGMHVYGLTGEDKAATIREAAMVVLDAFDGRYVAKRGNNFFRDTDPDYEAISIEVFPKQESLDGKDLGNLLRLPLGINQKSSNRGFFVKQNHLAFLSEMDPMLAMVEGVPW